MRLAWATRARARTGSKVTAKPYLKTHTHTHERERETERQRERLRLPKTRSVSAWESSNYSESGTLL